MSDDKLLTIAEVAARLRVGYDVARKRIRSGEIPCLRMSRRTIRVTEAQLSEYLTRLAGAVDGDGR